jgi:hypothetical protein
MTKRDLYAVAVGLAIVLGLCNCAAPNPPAQNPAISPEVAAPPAPPPPAAARRAPTATGDNLFAPTPGDMVQSPGIYVPTPAGPSSQGY